MTRVQNTEKPAAALRASLDAPTSSSRLQAAMAAGTNPHPEFIDVLIARCAEEPDFFVRDMLTWALIRQDTATTAERLLPELRSRIPQARSQALHTLSKLGDPDTWPAITASLLQDDDDEVARAAWRAAAALVPREQVPALAWTLSTQFNRGGRDVQLSLSRAFAALGDAASPAIEHAKHSQDEGVRTHATATEQIMQNPEEGFDAAIEDARRTVALLGAPSIAEE
ncbi:MAG TPA: HEAT repeat domain-containing protein [Candidatus Agrococcus pullicola]|uniref:HEAT repeat domain-containing protein n=1 Tax=Candidatus Agrococcus pullicola TaxID=2838429 RepID=A0A9D2C9M6_9MICO|nr:HEAT repeat domain-containing protein [Candidatus Agrococcus pullicola]